jgi:polyisoprenoid-binding protein YceI
MARYRIIPERSHVWVDAKSNVHLIHSETDGLEGYVDLEMDSDGRVDLASKPAAKLSLPVSRLSSGNRLEDRELYKRIDARRFPTIEGVLDQMERTADDGSYRVKGNINFRGVVRSHVDLMTISVVDQQTVKLEGRSHFDIREFGMEAPRMLMLRVEPVVEVRVAIVAVKEA